MLDPDDEDYKKITEILHELSQPENKFSHRKLRAYILESIVKHVKCEAPCCILQLDKFFSDKTTSKNTGEIIGQYHINSQKYCTEQNDGTYKFKGLGEIWYENMSESLSDIEEKIYQLYGRKNVYYVTRKDLFTNESMWYRSMYYFLSYAMGVPYLSYLWMRLTPEDLWIFCIRRGTNEKDFTEKDKDFIYNFGLMAFANRSSWYIPGLKKLSPREQDAVYHYSMHLDMNKGAEAMGIERTTFKYHIENVKIKLEKDTGKTFSNSFDMLINSSRLKEPDKKS